MIRFKSTNLEVKTLGGRVFWGDVVWFRGWRIQENVVTKQYRLLDPHDVGLAWGTVEECREALDRFKIRQRMAPLAGKAVVLVHGIARSSKSFRRLKRRLESAGYLGVPFDYPSTRVTMTESVGYLREVLRSLEGIEQIDWVAHSMGGLLVRHYLQLAGEQTDPRIRRMVMIGVPNQGARMASLLQRNLLYRWIMGPAGQQLVEDPEGFIARLPTPAFEFAIIAGARGTGGGWNPLVRGDDDGTVSVASTRLSGAKDFFQVRAAHAFIMNHKDVIEATVRFLETGCLREGGRRDPVH